MTEYTSDAISQFMESFTRKLADYSKSKDNNDIAYTFYRTLAETGNSEKIKRRLSDMFQKQLSDLPYLLGHNNEKALAKIQDKWIRKQQTLFLEIFGLSPKNKVSSTKNMYANVLTDCIRKWNPAFLQQNNIFSLCTGENYYDANTFWAPIMNKMLSSTFENRSITNWNDFTRSVSELITKSILVNIQLLGDIQESLAQKAKDMITEVIRSINWKQESNAGQELAMRFSDVYFQNLEKALFSALDELKSYDSDKYTFIAPKAQVDDASENTLLELERKFDEMQAELAKLNGRIERLETELNLQKTKQES